MGFELADIDDVVRLADGCYDVKGMILKACGTVYGFGAKVHVQLHQRRKLLHTADAVYIFHIFPVVKPAGAFSQCNVSDAVCREPLGNGFYDKRMGGGRKGRAFCHNQIGLYHDLAIRA